jgi:predicted nucleotidyltransferase
MNKKNILKFLKEKLLKLKPAEVILFGSAITDNFQEKSDIDIVVVLNKRGFSKNYREVIKNKSVISNELSELRKEIPIDLLVYTIDEWNHLKESGSCFFNEIREKGLKLI